jgi:hypothetical protein
MQDETNLVSISDVMNIPSWKEWILGANIGNVIAASVSTSAMNVTETK